MRRLLVLVALTMCITAHASTAMFGIPDCGSWIRSPSPWQKAWLLGYMSGLASMDPQPNVLNGVSSSDQLYLWMDNWCRANPLKSVEAGGNELYNELAAKKR